MNSVVTAIDAGAGPGTLEICSAAYASILIIFTFDDPCGSVAGSTLTFSGTPKSTTAGASGTASIARMKDSNGNIIVSGLSVGTVGSGANIEIDSVTINNGQSITLSYATLMHG